MKINRSLIILLALGLVIGLTGCKKEEKNYYPDCFSTSTQTPAINIISCGSVMLVNISKHQAILASFNDNNMLLTTQCKTFDVASNLNNLEISYYTYDNYPDSNYFTTCAGIAFMPGTYGTKIKWNAISGNFTIAVSKEKKNREDCEAYKACIELQNIRFVKENSTQDTILNSLVIKNAVVGTCVM
ncbi:MAG: hypothetical protein ABI723_02210 [Bacteroidia bacterium]